MKDNMKNIIENYKMFEKTKSAIKFMKILLKYKFQ